jgi:hypothetical protein
MGHISELPGDILWLILRRAIYADYRHTFILDSIIREVDRRLSLERDEAKTVICVVVRYAMVNRQWLRIIGSKMRRLPATFVPEWKFVKGAWADFHP